MNLVLGDNTNDTRSNSSLQSLSFSILISFIYIYEVEGCNVGFFSFKYSRFMDHKKGSDHIEKRDI